MKHMYNAIQKNLISWTENKTQVTLGPLDWDLRSTSENKYKISSRSIGLLPFSEALPKIPSKTWKKQKYRQGAAR